MRFVSRLVLAALALGVVLVPTQAPRAQALSAGLAFSADSSPTWQVDAVARAVGATRHKVFVGGEFDELRPPEGTAGKPMALTGLAVLDADSGKPAACQLPVSRPDGTPTVYALNASPDGSTMYVGGNFTSIGGVARNRVAAVDVDTCTVEPFQVPDLSASVYGITSTATTVYLAGAFVSAGDQQRQRFAAVDATSGALLPFRADADRAGRAVVVSPDGTKVALGGEFFTVNQTASHSLAVVDARTGAVVHPYGPGFVPDQSSTKSLTSDGSSFYAGNEGFSGTFDGRLAIDWATLDQRWRDDCSGATQAVLAYKGILYSANHVHNCDSMGYFPDGPRKYFVAQATSDGSFRGWTPLADNGTGEGLGPRALAVATGTGGATYLYAVGEFTTINGVGQQGITRFGTSDRSAPSSPPIQAESFQKGVVQVRVRTVVDNDDDTLTYRVYRSGSTKAVWTGRARSWWWSQPQITFTDKKVKVGKTYSYRVTASDGTNVSQPSSSVSVKVSSGSTTYPTRILADKPDLYWRYDDPKGTWVWDKGVDSTSALNGLMRKGAELGAPGALKGDAAASFDGVDDYAWSDRLHKAPSTYTLETWFRTTSRSGGKLVGFTDGRPQGNTGVPTRASHVDRQVYMDDAGRVDFGASLTTLTALRSDRSYNDGAWHHVVATRSDSRSKLYVDGQLVAGGTPGRSKSYDGVWFVGGGALSGWSDKPSSDYFRGDLDETAVYEGKVLAGRDVAEHYQAAGRSVTVNKKPGDGYGQRVYALEPSSYWPLNEKSGTVKDRSLLGLDAADAGKAVKRRVKTKLGDKSAVQLTGRSSSTITSKKSVDLPSRFSVALWFSTKGTKGGPLLSLESGRSGTGSKSDRVLYLTSDGRVSFGVRDAVAATTVSSKPVNDGSWHQLTAVRRDTTVALYVDGKLVAQQAVPTGQPSQGYWRAGAGTLGDWGTASPAPYLDATIDDIAVFPYALDDSGVSSISSR